MPTLFASVNPCLRARLDRGYKRTEKPFGISKINPVGINALS